MYGSLYQSMPPMPICFFPYIKLKYRTALELSDPSVICLFHENDSCSLSMCFFNELAWPRFTKRRSLSQKNLQLEQPHAIGLKGSLPSSGPMLRLNLKLHNRSCWLTAFIHRTTSVSLIEEIFKVITLKSEPKTSDGDPWHKCGR